MKRLSINLNFVEESYELQLPADFNPLKGLPTNNSPAPDNLRMSNSSDD